MGLRKTFPIIVLCTFIAACGDQKIVNDIKLVETVGYDAVENGVQSAAFIADYEEKGGKAIELFVTESKSVYDSLPRLNTKLNLPIEYGQLRMALFGETFARKGIEKAIDSMIRNPQISPRMQLGVADRDALEILKVAESKRNPYFLADMIEQNIWRGNLPHTNLHETFFNFYGEGRDIFLPYFTVERGEIKIDGLALFKGDHFTTKIGSKDAFILKMLLGNSKNGSVMIPMRKTNQKHDDFFLMNSIGSKSRLKVINLGPPASFSIRVNLDAQVKDVPFWIDLRSEDQLAWLEKIMGAYFEKEIQKFVSLCKKNKVDPVGFGDLIRSRSSKWNAQDFEEQYEALKMTVSVKVIIVQTGVGE
ncbi:Ger(x)C family spore germination protein [Paenibacillus filicis]|uniref:Ger(X)C family spore germination protein n=1 Tax=Paenibacillus gyeongsangnamensis TaxID=3388067 RepID=A0ABT4QF09_9BACL|nr:Ger(x)C family spore germination protein [Paenibacillus filicis]MCZ8515446.1 Ger(x)C family spore germination protein [Paenibacillus filicis]